MHKGLDWKLHKVPHITSPSWTNGDWLNSCSSQVSRLSTY